MHGCGPRADRAMHLVPDGDDPGRGPASGEQLRTRPTDGRCRVLDHDQASSLEDLRWPDCPHRGPGATARMPCAAWDHLADDDTDRPRSAATQPRTRTAGAVAGQLADDRDPSA